MIKLTIQKLFLITTYAHQIFLDKFNILGMRLMNLTIFGILEQISAINSQLLAVTYILSLISLITK